LNEASIDLSYNENRYGPEGGFNSMYFVTTDGLLNRLHTPYWDPPTYIPSSYAPIQILFSNDPIGDSGFVSQDSSIARIGAKRLKSLLEERINVERVSNITNFITTNYKITVPENPLSRANDFTTRLEDSYVPASPIPGDYFDENTKKGSQTNQTSRAFRTINTLTGGLLGPILNLKRNPSQIFLANTSSGQRLELFRNINLNRYQPDYYRFRGGVTGFLTSLGRSIVGLFDNSETQYYVGSSKKEPDNVKSPPNQIPVNEFGRQIQAPVYGPTDLSILYEGNETSLLFGLAGRSTIDGGGIDGQFVWTSPKYKKNAGFKATPGGGAGRKDEEFFLISSQYQKNESTNIGLKPGSILDDTQRLINSADNVTGRSRLKHVGNAINQVSKVFNDGYKEITKGSKVLSYVDNSTGREGGIEYARVFTKDTPYYTYNDLQKRDGITTSGRRFTNSILDNTYNLNIAPMRGPDSTNLKLGSDGKLYAKKYMFSIENLAWRTSSLLEDLPAAERGPNGGRVMWFPPYDIKFSDTSTPSFQGTSFLGRPEPMYTYKETSRSGTLSWKIIVDHPSILNVIVRKQLKGVRQDRINSIVDSFFAGCAKYDLYELARRFPSLPPSTIQAIQNALQTTKNTDDVNSLVAEIPALPDGNISSAAPLPNTIAETTPQVGAKPSSTGDTLEKLKSGLSKKILRLLLNESDYFDMIKEDVPIIYDSIKEKIRYFDPTFHSITPEGLNSRLTFLNQCVRPGETIPIVNNGETTAPNALNTSFGTPPILILRIGDFYHTKIVPDSMSFTYEPLLFDQNPEGIGVQPMIVNVSMNFKIIGGMGLAKPVEELQNALSFNFYANTEIYDERATPTEDTSVIDNKIFEQIKLSVLSPPSPEQSQTNSGGNTIGTILSNTSTTVGGVSGETGDINYLNIMNNLLSSTQGYFDFVVNKLESIQNEYNLGVVQILNYQRQYNFGSIQKSPFNPGNRDIIQIYGKPSGWQVSVENTFSRVQDSISNNTNPIIDFLSKFYNVNDDSFPIRDVKKNMQEYISNLQNDFLSPIATKVQDLVKQQQDYVQTIRKINVVVDKTDGKKGDKGTPIVYNISGVPYNTLVTDFGKLKTAMDRYVTLLSSGNNPIAFYESDTEVNLINDNKFNTQAEVDFFVIMSRILTDKNKTDEFINFVIKNELLSATKPVNLQRKFTKICDDLSDIYKNELKDESRVFEKLKKKQEYKNLTKGLEKIMYKLGVERVCGYTTIPNTSTESQQKTLLQNLYSSVNVNDDVTAFDGKIVFN